MRNLSSHPENIYIVCHVNGGSTDKLSRTTAKIENFFNTRGPGQGPGSGPVGAQVVRSKELTAQMCQDSN